MPWWASTSIGLGLALLLAWMVLAGALLVGRPRGGALAEAARLLPDLLRLIPRLARDDAVPRGVRVRLWLLLGYLALPIDLIPDFVPVLGYADDAILVAVVLRATIRAAGEGPVRAHWPGTDDGFVALRRVLKLP